MEFENFIREVHREFGLNLGGYKEKQLKRRIDSLMLTQGIGSYEDYLKVMIENGDQRSKFFDKVTINVSEFFRNPEIFANLERVILPDLAGGVKKLKIWSAACSNGAEPYSIAIILEEMTPKVSYRITATDIDTNILNVAKEGKYDFRALRNVTPERLSRFFEQTGDGRYSVSPQARKNVTFKKHDLLEEAYDTDYDLIVCRNVTIYFTRETQERIYSNFYRSLKDGGVLFIGATENIIQYRQLGFEKVSHWFYRKGTSGKKG